MANAKFTCVLDAWREGTTLFGRMHYYRTDGLTYPYQDSEFPDPTMNLGGSVYTDTDFKNRIRSGVQVGDIYSTTFSRTVSGTGTRTVTWTAGSGIRSDFAGTWSATVTGFPGVTTPPEDLTISAPYGITSTGATFDVSVSSYGTPASASGRYIEAAILETSNYNGNKRAAIASNVNSATITVDNNSTQVTSLTIRPNTEYYYGAYASNTQTSTMTVSGQFVTPPADPTVSVINVDGYSATIYYSVGSDGGHYNRILEYSLDGSTWNSAVTISDGNAHTGTFTIPNLQAHTSYNVWVRVKTDAGASPFGFVSFTTKSMFYGAAKHFGNLQLKGDTTQQTYSGKNLNVYPYYHSSGRVSQGITFTVNSDGSITLNGQNNNQGASTFTFIHTSTPISAGTYYCIPTGSSAIYTMNAGNWYNFKSSNNYSATIPTNTNIQEFYLEVLKGDTTVFDNFTIYPMLTTMANPTVADYEPYVGGIPAPNPDHPQEVQVVTGEQTVTITDGAEESQEYTVDLGNIELCKIGTYQDYIYKSGSDWYVHKETETHTTLTSEISLYSDNYSNIRYVVIPKPADSVYYGNYGNGSSIFFTAATWSTETSDWDNASKIGKIFSGASANNFWIGFPKSVTLADAQAKIGGANCCYRITTPTDTKITNADLVAQLNALYSAQTYGDDTVVTVTSADLEAGFSADYITTKRVEKLYGGVNAIGDLHIAGDTTQQTYSGKNLFNFDQFYNNRASFTTNEGTLNITQNSLEYAGHTSSGSQWYPAHEVSNKSIYGMTNLQPSTTYTISYKATGDTQCWVFFFNSSSVRTSVNQTFTATDVSFTFTTPADLSWYAVRLDNRTTSNTISNVQIVKGSTASSFEPYVGGIPAPNPDCPQTVNTVTGRQVVTISDGDQQSQSYEVNLGKNLINTTLTPENKYLNSTGGWTTDAGTNTYLNQTLFVGGGTSLTFSQAGRSNGNTWLRLGEYKADGTFIKRTLIGDTTTRTVTTDSACTKAVISMDFGPTNYFTDPMLERGTTATTYAPYVSHYGRNINGGYSTNVSRNSGNLTWNNKADGTITVTAGTSSGEYSMLQADAIGNRMLTLPAGTYTLSGGNSKVQLSFRVKDGADTTTGPTGKVTFTLNSQTQGFIRALVGNGVTVTAQTLFPQLESGSTSTPYQQFIGGQLELCKIGTYQDYIYKSGSDWYVHKETGTTNVTANGWNGAAHGNRFTFPVPTNALHPLNSTIGNGYGTSIPLGAQGSTWDAVNDSWVLTASDGLFWTHATQNISSTADINNWLASHPFTIYYPLAAPTDTQITNADLVAQLDALRSATTYRDDTVVITASPYIPAQVTAIWISSREILKLYGSVNGQAKLVYKALS